MLACCRFFSSISIFSTPVFIGTELFWVKDQELADLSKELNFAKYKSQR